VASKRDQELQRAREARRREQLAEQRRRRMLIGGVAGGVVLAVLVIAGAFALAGNDDTSPTPPDASSTTSPTTTPTTTAKPSSVKCAKPGDLQTKAQQFPEGPSISGLTDSTYGLMIETNCGDLEIEFNPQQTPQNVANLIFLANTGATKCVPKGARCGEPSPNGKQVKVQGYFDNTLCHRLTTEGIFVLQCGDPTGTGTGNPGYAIVDEALDVAAATFEDAGDGRVIYPRGTVAMANSGPNTAGSQFFLVYEDSPLAPNYTVVGRVTKGLEILDKVADQGSTPAADGTPNQPVELIKVNSFERRPIS
jgi:peptidyl-prolyl cis-trans isomerase B (cyclophilin B)